MSTRRKRRKKKIISRDSSPTRPQVEARGSVSNAGEDLDTIVPDPDGIPDDLPENEEGGQEGIRVDPETAEERCDTHVEPPLPTVKNAGENRPVSESIAMATGIKIGSEEELWDLYDLKERKLILLLDAISGLTRKLDRIDHENDMLIDRKQSLDIKADELRGHVRSLERKLDGTKERMDHLQSLLVTDRELQGSAVAVVDRLGLELELTRDEIWLRDHWFNATSPLMEHLAGAARLRDEAVALAHRGGVTFEIIGVDEERRRIDELRRVAAGEFVAVDGISEEMVTPLFDAGYHTVEELVVISEWRLEELLGISAREALMLRWKLDGYYYSHLSPYRDTFANIIGWHRDGGMDGTGAMVLIIDSTDEGPSDEILPADSYYHAVGISSLLERWKSLPYGAPLTSGPKADGPFFSGMDPMTMGEEISMESMALSDLFLKLFEPDAGGDSDLPDQGRTIVLVRVREFMEDSPGLMIYDNTRLLTSGHLAREVFEIFRRGSSLLPGDLLGRARDGGPLAGTDAGDEISGGRDDAAAGSVKGRSDISGISEHLSLFEPELVDALADAGYQVLLGSSGFDTGHYTYLLSRLLLSSSLHSSGRKDRVVELVVNRALWHKGLGPVLDAIGS